MKTWQRWQDAQIMLQKKRETEARLLWANKPDKLQQAKEEISEVRGTPKPDRSPLSIPVGVCLPILISPKELRRVI